MTGFIYAIGSGDGFVKIGWSRDPPRRLTKIRSDIPHDCELLGTCPGTKEQESSIHNRLSASRVRKEWFRRGDAAVDKFVQSLSPHPKKQRKYSDTPIGRFRRGAEMTLEQLGRRAGTTKQTICLLEAGKRTPSLDLMFRLVDATNGAVQPSDFLLISREVAAE